MNLQHSITRQYLFWTFLIPFILVTLTASVLGVKYVSLQEKKYENYVKESVNIAETLGESLSYVENFMQFLAEKIAETGTNDPHVIAGILQRKARPSFLKENVFTWTFFDFVSPEGNVIADSTRGVLDQPIHITAKKRSWIIGAKQKPWMLHFSGPDIGVTSGEPIISLGYGVTDKEKRFLGTISIGLNIPKLTRQLKRSTNKEATEFMIVDKDLHIIMQSSRPIPEKGIEADFFSRKLNALSITDEKATLLKEPLHYEGVTYYYYRELHPYRILVGEKDLLANAEFEQQVQPAFVQAVVMGAILVFLLWFFRRTIVKPLGVLSNAAFGLSHGKLEVTIPPMQSTETENLARALIQIKEHQQQLKAANQALTEAKEAAERAVHMAKSSELEKREFIRKINHGLNDLLNSLLLAIEMMQTEYDSKATTIPLTATRKQEMLQGMYDNVLQLKYRITKIISLSPVEVKGTIQKCVTTSALRSLTQEIEIIANIEENLPPFLTDELRFKQLIVALLARSIEYHVKGGNIWLSVEKRDIKGKPVLEITVRDDAPGLPENIRQRLEHKYDNGVSIRSDGTDLEFEAIEIIVNLLKGTLHIQSRYGERGNKVTVLLPYLTKEELEEPSEKKIDTNIIHIDFSSGKDES